MQSLRTSSPFTNAQEWYSGSEEYDASGAPVTANAGLGITTESTTRRALLEEGHDDPYAPQEHGDDLPEDAAEGETTIQQSSEAPYHGMQDKDFDDLESYDDEKDFDDDEAEEGDFMSVNGDDADFGGDSVYEDAVYEMSATERHEDRIDAFDYEHFFLHSAMGTYGLDGRRSSTGSGSSTATTRPVTAVQTQDDDESSTEKRVSYHARNDSSASVSTIASFATAAEEQDDDDEENERMDQFSQQMLSQQRPPISRPVTSSSFTALRSDSAINMRRATTGSSPPQTTVPRSSTSPVDLASGLQVSKIFSILTESSSPGREEPRLALSEEEKQLIYSLAVSFQQVCSGLQHTDGEQYERKEARRRLDDARRVLNGEDAEDDDSF